MLQPFVDNVKPKKEDWPVMPAFLKRKGGRLSDEALRAIVSPRDWIMPSDPRSSYQQERMKAMEVSKETIGAHEEHSRKMIKLVGERNLPIKLTAKDLKGRTTTIDMDDAKKLDEWYNPSKYVIIGRINDDTMTLVTAEEFTPIKGESAKKVNARNAKEKRRLEKEAKKAATAEAKKAPPVKGKKGAPPPPVKGKKGAAGAVETKKAAPAKKSVGGPVRHGVTVGGKEYSSVLQAFVALKLDRPAHIKFRGQLKKSKSGKMVYEEGGKKYEFALFEHK